MCVCVCARARTHVRLRDQEETRGRVCVPKFVLEHKRMFVYLCATASVSTHK